jgi:hypothetical protein
MHVDEPCSHGSFHRDPQGKKNTDSPKGAKVATDWGASGDELVAAEFCIDEAWARFCLLYPVDNPVVARKK